MDDSGSKLSGSYDFRFTLCDGDGTPVSPTIEVVDDYPVVDGLVTVRLAFGQDAFDGEPRYLQIEVREGESEGSFTLLSPRQELTATPYAFYAARAPWAGVDDVPPDLADGDQDTTYSAGTGLTLVGTALSVDTGVIQRRVEGTCGGGSAVRAIHGDGTVECEAVGGSGAWSLTGNAGTTPGTDFLGTTDDEALELRVNGARALRLEPDATSPNVIGGYSGNDVSAFRLGATVGGGGKSGEPNQVSADYGTVGGGKGNTAGGDAASVAGGSWNTAGSGGAATVGGGSFNTASSHHATIAGGLFNQATEDFASIGGGESNQVIAEYGTIGGGGGDSFEVGNRVSDSYGTVGGGHENLAGDGTGGTDSASYATVAGGRENVASGSHAAVGGGWENEAQGDQAAVGGGRSNVAGYAATVCGGWNNRALADYSAIGGGGSATNVEGNEVTDNWGTVGGGFDNQAGDGASSYFNAEYATVGGGHTNVAGAEYATVGGGQSNSAGETYATAGGGLENDADGYVTTIGGGEGNRAPKDYAAVGGGNHNTASGWAGTIAGGDQNVITGTNPHAYATIGGGRYNEATANFATIGGGGGDSSDYRNEVRGSYGTVGGGSDNVVEGEYGTVPGGRENTAWGDYSFAAGRKAYASHDGSFVFSSGIYGANSWGENTFTVRSEGGARFYSAVGTGTGVQLSDGGTSWGSISDRNVKENYADLDRERLLASLTEMPVQTWNLKSQDREMRHVGPVAQDFNDSFAYLFGELEDPLRINTMDAVGISLAAAQGLHDLAQDQSARIEALTAEKAALEQRVEDLEARVAALEAAMEGGTQRGALQSGILPGAGLLLTGLGLVWFVRRPNLQELLGRDEA
jgi:hypothetical protein